MIAVLAPVAFAACTKIDQTGEGTAGGTLRVGIQRSPNTLNPILTGNTTEAFINRLSFDTLLSVDASGQHAVPILAEAVPSTANGGISSDGRTIVYHLRRGVRWQDGAPFTSRDVKFTWQQLMNPNNDIGGRNGYDRVTSVDTPDPSTVVFHLHERWAPFVNTVFAESDSPYCILPAHLLAGLHDLNRIPFNERPIGTGPFRVVDWVHGDHIDLVANDDYFRGKPHLRRIVIREIPDEGTEINALRTHDIDWMFEASPETIDELRPLEAAGTIRIVTVKMPETYRIYINTTEPLLRDVRVRQALAYAIDKKRLVDLLTGGTAVPATADQPDFSPFYNPDVMIYRPDPRRARALLRAAGVSFDPAGTARWHGRPVSFQLSYNVENATRREIAIQAQAMLRDIGIDAPIKPYPANLYFANYGQGGIMTNAKYDLAVSGWIAGFDPDDNTLYGCDQFPPNGSNYTRYCTPQMQALQAEALGTNDDAVRKRAYDAIQRLIAHDVPDIILMYPRMLQPIDPAFKNFAPNPINEAWNAFLWET